MTSWLPVVVLEVAGIPKGQPRPRACIRGRHASVYDPGTADAWRAAIVLEANVARPASPITAAVCIVVTFHFPAPKRRKAGASTWNTSKPDIDNALKAVLDALTDAGFWTDDSLVVDIAARKMVAGPGEEPGATIEIFREKE
jgi:Holliday junction resolvase RusA-like endonuclease